MQIVKREYRVSIVVQVTVRAPHVSAAENHVITMMENHLADMMDSPAVLETSITLSAENPVSVCLPVGADVNV